MSNDFYARLRRANIERLPQFKNKKGEPAHAKPDGSDWSLIAWCNAILGELGEAANVIKKIERGDFSLEEGRVELGKEIADVLTYLDITAFRFGAPGLEPFRTMHLPTPKLGTSLSVYYSASCALNLAGLIDIAMNKELFDDHSLPPEAIAASCNDFAWCLTALASVNGIDIERATTDKFNEVSRRVNSSVFI